MHYYNAFIQFRPVYAQISVFQHTLINSYGNNGGDGAGNLIVNMRDEKK